MIILRPYSKHIFLTGNIAPLLYVLFIYLPAAVHDHTGDVVHFQTASGDALAFPSSKQLPMLPNDVMLLGVGGWHSRTPAVI